MSRRPLARVEPRADVVYAWPAKSDRITTVYEVLLRADGAMSCDCPGWIYAKKGQERTCKHVQRHAGEAPGILQRIAAGERVEWRIVEAPRPGAPAIATTPRVTSLNTRRRAIAFQ